MMDIHQRVDQYVKLRDEVRRLELEFEEKLAPYKKAKEDLGLLLLQLLDAQNAESVRTLNGTVYKTKKQSVSIKDKEAFWNHVVANEAWELIDKRANVTGCVDYAEEHKTMPPGVNYSAIWTVGVRRA
jgi:hypothetical protein